MLQKATRRSSSLTSSSSAAGDKPAFSRFDVLATITLAEAYQFNVIFFNEFMKKNHFCEILLVLKQVIKDCAAKMIR